MNRHSTILGEAGGPDVQARRPRTEVSLTRVGVVGVEKVIRINPRAAGGGGGRGQLFFAEFECFVDLNPRQAGAHMSRFEEVVNEAIDEAVLAESLKAEHLAASVAERVRDRQGGMRAEVSLAARYPETVPAPLSGKPTQEIYTLFGTAVASEAGTRMLTGVQAQGMTACPCAQEMIAAGARERLAAGGYDDSQIEEILDLVPVATHNQRGVGTLYIGRSEECETEIDARELLAIVESSMSSEIYELMKREDERSVVEKAHANPRFVEDCVREMVRRLASAHPDLHGRNFIYARQENFETIHRHNVIAERSGELSEVLTELETGEHSRRHMTMREWLDAAGNA
ncbi:MAG: GTP cyclohydrolase I FolE2 [Solirubrobacterales bacterium]|nr:GTP cyclohydrolase I FolE2 [Solirubrobacterales bacterium]